jgi:hypothetical protein
MIHRVAIHSFEQEVRAIRVLDQVGGTFSGAGTSENPLLFVNDAQCKALIEANVISPQRQGGQRPWPEKGKQEGKTLKRCLPL